jgi:hypothetical protein
VRFSLTATAGPGVSFGAHAFDELVGQDVPVEFPGGSTGRARLVAARVYDCGHAAELTYEPVAGPFEMTFENKIDRRYSSAGQLRIDREVRLGPSA